MKSLYRKQLLLAALLLFVAGCESLAQTASKEYQPLTYVGDVKFGEPVASPQEVEIPVSFENGEWLHNSAIVPLRLVSEVKGRDIDITVQTSLPTQSTGKVALKLPSNASGEYHIYYKDPDGTRTKLKDIQIPIQ